MFRTLDTYLYHHGLPAQIAQMGIFIYLIALPMQFILGWNIYRVRVISRSC